MFRDDLAVAPTGSIILSGITDDDKTVNIVKVPAAIADISFRNPKLTVYISLFPARTPEKETVKCIRAGDKCIGAESGSKRAGGE